MKDMLKTASILALIALIAAAVLAFIEKITREPIRQVAILEKKKARQALVAAHRYEIFLPEILKADSIDKQVLPALKNKGLDLKFSRLYRKQGSYYLLNAGAVGQAKSELTDALTATRVSTQLFATLVNGARKSADTTHTFLCTFSRIYTARRRDGSFKGFVFECSAPEGYADTIELVTGVTFDSNGVAGISDYTVIKSSETPGLGKAAEEALHRSFTNSSAGVRTLSNFNPADTEKDVKTGATITSMAIKDALYASLKLALHMKGKLQPQINIADSQLLLAPYGVRLEKTGFKERPAGLAALYKAKWPIRGMGHIALLSLKAFDAGKGHFRRLMLAAGIRSLNNMLTFFKVFEYDEAKKGYAPVVSADLAFYMSTEDKIGKMYNEKQKPLKKKALKMLLDLYSFLKKGGR